MNTRLHAAAFLLLTLLLSSLPSLASEGSDPEAFSQAELDQMLAPIALYPDALLAQILMASTYPLEVVEAARWSRSEPGIEGSAAVEAVSAREWAPSVKALVAFPRVLGQMDEDLGWTRGLGDAFLLQEEQVMETVQGLRQKAHAAGSLESLEHVRVSHDREVIVIQPANPQIVYVPYYQPASIYGGWWWPSYPPVYWSLGPGYPYHGSHVIWSSGVRVSTVFFYSQPDWHRRHIVVVNQHRSPVRVRDSGGHIRTRYLGGERWRHEAAHRRGVTYRSESLNDRFGRSPASGRESLRSWRETRSARETALPSRMETDPVNFRRSWNRDERAETVPSTSRRARSEEANRVSRSPVWTESSRGTWDRTGTILPRPQDTDRVRDPSSAVIERRNSLGTTRERAPSSERWSARTEGRSSVPDRVLRERPAVPEAPSSRDVRTSPSVETRVRAVPERPAPVSERPVRVEPRQSRPQDAPRPAPRASSSETRPSRSAER